MRNVQAALKDLPWVDKNSVKVNFKDQNAQFHVPDMSAYSEPAIKGLPGKDIYVQQVKPL